MKLYIKHVGNKVFLCHRELKPGDKCVRKITQAYTGKSYWQPLLIVAGVFNTNKWYVKNVNGRYRYFLFKENVYKILCEIPKPYYKGFSMFKFNEFEAKDILEGFANNKSE